MNVTRHPTSTWIAQQVREAFPYESAPRFLLFDHDQKYGLEVLVALRSLQITCVRTSIRSPWQNGVAERWVESCRRDLLDHIIAVNERHLKRLLADYIRCYHDDRTHLGLRKQTPVSDCVQRHGVALFLIHDSVACAIGMNGRITGSCGNVASLLETNLETPALDKKGTTIRGLRFDSSLNLRLTDQGPS